jgi:DnaJ-class molecular chaperone
MDIDLDESLKILEIGFPLSLKKISSAYRNQMKKYHPDINKSKNAQEKSK